MTRSARFQYRCGVFKKSFEKHFSIHYSYRNKDYEAAICILDKKRKFNFKSNPLDTAIFLNHLRSYVDVPEPEFREFLTLLTPLQLKKDEHFYRAGEVPRYSPFILKGCLRQYVLNKDGEEQIILFNEEGNWAGQIGSMRTNIPTNVYLQALEDCEILGITLAHIDIGMERFPWYQRYFLKKYPADHARLLEQANRLKTESPETLYRELLLEKPSLILRVPQYYIANYLGIRTETLSRIRSKIIGY